MSGSIWTSKGGALSDKSAREEYGLTQAEIRAAIRGGDLQFRENHMHGNPYLRLLRAEVEELVKALHGPGFLAERKLRAELTAVEREIRSCKSKLKKLEAQGASCPALWRKCRRRCERPGKNVAAGLRFSAPWMERVAMGSHRWIQLSL